MPATVADNFKLILGQKRVDLTHSTGDTFKACLMASGFVFDRATHKKYADVSASELITGKGYTSGGTTLAGGTFAVEPTTHAAIRTFDNFAVNVSGGSLTAAGLLIFDDTVTTPDADPIVGYIDFGGDSTTQDGGVFTVANISIPLS